MDKYRQIEHYSMKVRAYPNKTQAEMIRQILNGMRIAYNMSLYEIKNLNPELVKPSKDGSVHFPVFKNVAKASWLNKMREQNPKINAVPSTSLASMHGLFLYDMKKSWEMSGKLPVEKWDAAFYSDKKPRRSYLVQIHGANITASENDNVLYINTPKVGRLKVRGWNRSLRYGNDALTLEKYFEAETKQFDAKISMDNLGDFYISIGLPLVWVPETNREKTQVGIDVGIKDVAILSDGTKFPNLHFAKAEKHHKKILSRRLSRRQGWRNEEFRARRRADKELDVSKTYERTSLKLAKLEKRIQRKRKYYYDCISKTITDTASLISIEDLNVKGMMKNRHLSYALADAAMSDLLSKIQYKSAWKGVEVRQIGRYEPSSRKCSVCGHYMKDFKLSVREWTCPVCGTHHDRDVNAAKNILKIGLEKTE